MPESAVEPSREALLARIATLEALLEDASARTVRLQAHVSRHCAGDSAQCRTDEAAASAARLCVEYGHLPCCVRCRVLIR